MKDAKKTIAYIVSGIAIGVFAIALFHALFLSPSGDLTTSVDAAGVNDYPINILIPALKINTSVQEVGMTSSGKMAVPDNFTDVGWYKYGTVPGQVGSAVIAGHVDDGLSFPGVFVNLDKLKVGDDIYLTMKDGTTLHFVMTGSKAYDKDASTSSIFDDDSGRLLKLITCTGTWLPNEATHDQRLVVTAKLVKN